MKENGRISRLLVRSDLADLALSLFGPENGIELEPHPPVQTRPALEFDR